jgi:predicted transposase YdaD
VGRSAGSNGALPLCRQARPAREALAYAVAAITQGETDAVVRADLLTTLAIFAKLAYPRLDVLGLIGREQMRESKIYEEIKDEGRLEVRRADVLEAVEIKFGAEARSEFAPLLEAVRDSDRLAALHRLVLRARDLSEFRGRFEAP